MNSVRVYRGCGRRPPLTTMPNKAPIVDLPEFKRNSWAVPCPPSKPIPSTTPQNTASMPNKPLEVRGGWPGVRGRVYVNVPVANRFGEMIIVEQNANGYLTSRVIGRVH